MEIAIEAIRPLIPKLCDLLVGEFTLEKRVRKGIESLMTELMLMHAALSKVAKVPAEQLDEGVKIWAGKVKELSYQMEDIVDTYMVRLVDGDEHANPKNKIKKLLKKIAKLFKRGRDLHRISDAIEEAVGQTKQLAELRQRYEQEICVTNGKVGARIDPRVMSLYTDATELVGIDDRRDYLISMLLEGNDWLKQPLKVVSIVGFGGLGKTTLAKAVYDKIKVQFHYCAFVSVSQHPNMMKVFKDILYGLDKEKYVDIHNAIRDETQLIDELRDFLQDKRYLVVIDDIWDEKLWKLIMCAFSKYSLGSRLITTTRILSVSEACCSYDWRGIYRIKPLSKSVSKFLFYKRVFSHENGCPQELLRVSKKILKKCGGVPLAIVTIASILASNHQIKTKEQWYALLNSIGHGLTEDHSVEDMRHILLLSYYDLPSHLKPCLLYLSIFPEDHIIMRGELIWRWIAEGFIHSERQGTSLYELGESYFNELVNRSMMQAMGIDDEERVASCCVHDMVLDLICSLSSEENFVTILDGSKRKMSTLPSKVRRISIQNSKVDVATIPMQQVRSLAFFTSAIVDLVPFVSNFQVLRVLDLEGCSVPDLRHVVNLLHLRYLGLKNTKLDDLPVEIGKLRLLQTLDVRGTNMKELPSSLVQLRHLMCMYVRRCVKLPSGMGNLTSLEVLSCLLVGQLTPSIINLDIMRELGHLTNLRVLRLQCHGLNARLDESLVLHPLVESLRNLHKLESLDIYYADGGRIDLMRDGQRMDLMREGWVPPPQLRRLKLQGCCSFLTLPSSLSLLSYLVIWVHNVRPGDIQLLGTLPALSHLYLARGDLSPEERVMKMAPVTANAFPRAVSCEFIRIAAVPSIFPQGAMPRLSYLKFTVPAMWIARGDMDFGMGHLPSLRRVTVDLLCKEVSVMVAIEAEAALNIAVHDHPNRSTPGLHILKCWQA